MTRHQIFLALTGLALLGAISISGCATEGPAYHKYVMQGQVLSVDNNTLTVCVGEHEGAKVGQVFEVVRHVPRPSSPKSASPSFSRQEIGKVRIASLFDEHYATALVLDGSPLVNDEVVLESPGRE